MSHNQPERKFQWRQVKVVCILLAVAGNALAGSPTIWRESDDYIRLDAASTSNQHPVNFSTDQLAKLLSRFQKIDRSKKSSAYFSEEEIQRLATAASGLFASADGKNDIAFGSSYRPGGFILQPRLLNTGRLFVENGRLNLLIGLCAALPEDPALQDKIRFKELDQGSRTAEAQGLRCQLIESDGTQRVNNRADWLRLDINAVLAAPQPAALPTNATQALTFGQRNEPTKTVVTPAPATPAAATVTAPTRPSASPLPSYPSAGSPSDAEERLTTLKRLHSKGLISDAEYDQKRAEVLKSL